MVVLLVMHPTQWNRKFVAGLASHRSRLRKAEMVCIGGTASAQQTRLQRDKPQMGFVSKAAELAKGKHALIDLYNAGRVQVRNGCFAGTLCGRLAGNDGVFFVPNRH